MNILYFLSFLPLFYSQTTWSTVDQILQAGIANQTYPGCTALVATKDGIVYQKAFGNYTYGIPPPYVPNGTSPNSNPPMQLSTLFDLASCSKVFATTTVIALLYQNKYLQLETRVSDPTLLGPNYSQNNKGSITVLNLLLHNAGYPPDPSPNYYEKSFGCPASQGPAPHPEDFTCRTKIYNSILAQTLQYPTGTQMIYSDLSFMTLMFVAGKVIRTNNLVSQSDLLPDCMVNGDGDDAAQCYYEAYVRQIFQNLGLSNTGYLPPMSRAGDCAPTENDTNYESGFWGPNAIQGVVSDGNAYILGGVGGHAGFFSNVLDLAKFLQEWMWGKTFNPDVVTYFTTQYNKTQSSRALGWDTNDGSVTDYGFSQVCGANMSSTTFLHTGYTGTMVCANPKSNYFTLLLTTRVYPTDSTGSTNINNVRRAFSQAVVDILGP